MERTQFLLIYLTDDVYDLFIERIIEIGFSYSKIQNFCGNYRL